MKKFLMYLLLTLLVIFSLSLAQEAKKPKSVKVLGNFEEPVIYQAPQNWYIVIDASSPAEAEEYGCKKGVFYIIINNVGTNFWHIQFGTHTPLKKNTKYVLKFDASSTKERDIQVRAIVNQAPWPIIDKTVFNLTPEMKTYTWEFTLKDDATTIVFDFGKISDKSVPSTIILDNVILEEY
ncbi:MAG: laminarinase [Dictyoglomus sp. NZ13-RE01]|nr:MAG: laminarinase [Dictyoglomus sp. NZ13-RE01]